MLTHPITVYSHVHVHSHTLTHTDLHAIATTATVITFICTLLPRLLALLFVSLHFLLFNSSPLGDVGLDHLKLLAGLQIPVCLRIHLAPECTWERGRKGEKEGDKYFFGQISKRYKGPLIDFPTRLHVLSSPLDAHPPRRQKGLNQRHMWVSQE